MQFGVVQGVCDEEGELRLGVCRRGRVLGACEEVRDELGGQTGDVLVPVEGVGFRRADLLFMSGSSIFLLAILDLASSLIQIGVG